MKLKIKDIPWRIRLFSNEVYEKEHGHDSVAMCVKHLKELHFQTKDISEATIRHEVFHAFVESCCLGSTDNISGDDMEEIGAEIVGYHASDICIISKKILTYLKKEKKRIK